MIQVGDKMPVFEVLDQDGRKVSSKDLIGKKTIIYFYPKDNTSGCTAEACNLRDNYEALVAKGYNVIGVSKDSPAALSRFEEKHGLPFLLLSDADLTVSKSYEVWQEKKLYGKTSFGVVRSTYIINEEGIITHALYKVKPDENARQVLDLL